MSAANERERRPKTENARSDRGSRDLRRDKGTLFDVVEHYAGRPVAVKSDDKCESRIHKCPMCRNNSYKARVYNDARPQGSGFVGCTTKGCSVPSKTDALGTVAHFQQLSGSRLIPEAMRHIDEILTPKKTPPDWRQSFTPTQQQTPTGGSPSRQRATIRRSPTRNRTTRNRTTQHLEFTVRLPRSAVRPTRRTAPSGARPSGGAPRIRRTRPPTWGGRP